MKIRLCSTALGLLALTTILSGSADPGFVAHEWGTFTSVQGADGVQMDWNPLVAPELPRFVYDRARPRAGMPPALTITGKAGIVSRQRMETPVIYFYSEREREIDVQVRFPEGTVTEWYPQEGAADLRFPLGGRKLPVLHWSHLRLKPDAPVSALLTEPAGSHYYAARETDATLLQVSDAKGKAETEKFLFYRGVATFQAPLTVKTDRQDPRQMTLVNTGKEELRHLFICENSVPNAGWCEIERLAPGESRTVTLAVVGTLQPLESLGGTMRAALVREGLYEREAAAMVATWEGSWFQEKGRRVLYTLPRSWTDRTLPLAIAPAPTRTARVMVARAEIITPTMEQALLRQVDRFLAAAPAERPGVAAATGELGLGRFLVPASWLLYAAEPRARQGLGELMSAMAAPVKQPEAKLATH